MGRARAMMNFAGPTTDKRKQLWCAAANTATMLDNILVHEQNIAPRYTTLYGQDVKYAKHLQTFGEDCATADTSNKVGRTKLDTRGRMCIFISYSTQDTGDVYKFLHMKTHDIIYSQDVEWLGKMWYELYNIPSSHSADAYVDPFNDYIERNSTGQEVEENVQETDQVVVKAEDPSFEEEEQIAARTRSHNP